MFCGCDGIPEWGIHDDDTAGGCCFLTNQRYARKLGDLWDARGERTYELDDIMLLKVGRHLRPRSHFKLIIAREDGENKFLRGYRKQFTSLRTVSHPGPLTLADGKLDSADLDLAARLTARYSQGRDAEQVSVEITTADGNSHVVGVPPLRPDEIPAEWHI